MPVACEVGHVAPEWTPAAMAAPPVAGATCVVADVPRGRSLALCGGLTAPSGVRLAAPGRCPEAPGGLAVGDGGAVAAFRLDCPGRYGLSVEEGGLTARLEDGGPEACAHLGSPPWRPDVTGRGVVPLAGALPDGVLARIPEPLHGVDLVPGAFTFAGGAGGVEALTGTLLWAGGRELVLDGFPLTLGAGGGNVAPMGALGGREASFTVGPLPIDVHAPATLTTRAGGSLVLETWGSIVADPEGTGVSLQRVRTQEALACGGLAVPAGTPVAFVTSVTPEPAPSAAQLGCACFHPGTALPPTACSATLGAPSELTVAADWARVSWSAAGCEELCR